jgi:hypothetical protein
LLFCADVVVGDVEVSTELKTATNMFINVVKKIKSTKYSFIMLARCLCPFALKCLYNNNKHKILYSMSDMTWNKKMCSFFLWNLKWKIQLVKISSLDCTEMLHLLQLTYKQKQKQKRNTERHPGTREQISYTCQIMTYTKYQQNADGNL